jgi:DNA-binding winged helix-turn-helix (wHTH) protein
MQPASGQPATCFEFGELRLDIARRILLRGSEPIHLTPKEFEILIALIEHPDRVVRKEELMSRVWPDTCVEEGNLTQNVSLLRKQLGETAEGKTYIETVPKLGYRIAVPVRPMPENGSRDPASRIPPRLLWAVLLVVFLLWSWFCFLVGQKFASYG